MADSHLTGEPKGWVLNPCEINGRMEVIMTDLDKAYLAGWIHAIKAIDGSNTSEIRREMEHISTCLITLAPRMDYNAIQRLCGSYDAMKTALGRP